MAVSAPVQVLNYQGSGTTSSSASATVTAPVPVGALLVVVVHRYNSSGVNAVSVSGGSNSLARAVGSDQGSNHSDIFYGVVTTALTSGVDSIVASVAAGAYVWKVTAFYVTGFDASTPIKADTAVGGATAASTSVTWSDTIAAAANGDLVVAAVSPGQVTDITTPPTTYAMLSRLAGTGAGTGMTLTNAVGSGGETTLPPAMTMSGSFAKSAAAVVIQAAVTSPQTFSYTGAQQTMVVPAGVTQVTIDAQGAEGYFFAGGTHRGGGRAVGTFAVTPGETLYINVGGQPSGAVRTGGWNGGGDGGAAASSFGRGGGGASDVRQGGTALANRLLAAGGAGGGGNSNSSGGGVGGGATGGASSGGGVGGAGGSQVAGGSPGSSGGTAGTAGAQGVGGGGGGGAQSNGGGGGGGGWYGGGGGASSNAVPGGGGGGSNGPTAALSVDTQDYRQGHGQVIISWVDAVVTGTLTAAPALSAVATVALTRTADLSAAPTLSATGVPALVRTGNLPATPVLTAVAFSDDGTRAGTLTAAPVLSASAVVRLTRTADLAAAPVLTATQTSQTSSARTATLTPSPVLSAVAVISKQTRTALLTVAPQLSGPGVPELVTPAGPPVVGQVDLRVRAYAPNGASLGILPAPSGTRCAMPLNDVPALTLTYGVNVPRAELLGQPLELAVEITGDGGNTWTEPPDGRFLYLTDGRDPANPADEYSAEAKGYVWRLTKARVLAEGALNGEGRREFSGVGVGTLFGTLWAEAQARGALSGMTLQGGGLSDAAGVPFYIPLTRAFDVGQDLLSVLLDLEAAGYLDFRMEGRTLRIFNKDMATDRTVTAEQVTLLPLQVTEAPFRRTWEGLADNITVLGDEGATVTINNAGALRPWGRWEDFVTAGGVSDLGTLTTLGQRYQTLTADVRQELTHGLALGVGQTPLIDFWLGDYIWSQPTMGAKARYRVRQVTLEKDGLAVQGNVILNDRFVEGDILTRRMIDAITSGASTASTGPVPTPPGPDILQPAAVTSLLGSSSTYVDNAGTTWGQVALDWPDVTTNLDGTPLTDLDHYQVQVRKGDSSSALQWQNQPDTSQSRASYSPYLPGEMWSFRVRAVDSSNNWGPWSPLLTLTISADTTGPVKPSTPTATSRLGNGAIAWDGKAVGGLLMDADFDHGDIHLSTVSGFAWGAANRFTSTSGAETVQVGPLTMGVTYYGRLVPYDTSGNAGTPSDQFTFAVAALVDVTNFPDTAMQDLYARTAHFISLDADQVTANGAAIGFLETGAITGGIFETSAGGEFRTAANPAASGGVRIRGTDGFKAFGNKGVGGGPVVQTVSIDPTTGLISAQGGSFTGVTVSSGTPGGVTAALESSGGIGMVSFYDGVTRVGTLGAGSLLGSSTVSLTSASGGSAIIGNNTANLYGSAGINIYGPLTFSGDLIPSNLPTVAGAPNMRLATDGKVYYNPNVTYGADNSGGTGFKLVRVPN